MGAVIGDPSEPTAARVRAAVEEIWLRNRASALERVDFLANAIAATLDDRLPDADRREAERAAHQLAGSVGIFGFQRASALAREIETVLAGGEPIDRDRLLEAADSVVALRGHLEADPEVVVAEQPAPATSIDTSSPRLAVAVHAATTEADLFAEASARGYRPVALGAPGDVTPEDPPVVAVVDLDLPEQRGFEVLEQLSACEPPVPSLALTSVGRFGDRVAAARSGARWFLPSDATPEELLDAVEGMLKRAGIDNTTVLAVDDDPSVLAAVEAVLSPAGLDVVTTGSAHDFWAELEHTSPDLVVLDLDMPDVRGDDLCQVLRGDRRWVGLPILFLTGRTDPDTVSAVFTAGADDFVAKPFAGPELLARINNRLERTRLFKAFAETDVLTGLANRRHGEPELAALLRLSERFRQPLSVALLDLDHFKRVNDRFGHGTGDTVLRRFGALLAGAFRGEDVVARWGGEEFLVAMYGMPRDDAVQRVVSVLEQVRAEEFLSPDGEPFAVTFSGGLSTYPDDADTVADLCAAADHALYRAKEAGRDRILSAGTTGGGRAAGR